MNSNSSSDTSEHCIGCADQTNGNENVYIPVLFCLTEALILSIILNIYFLCTRRYSVVQCCQRFRLFTCKHAPEDEEASEEARMQDDQNQNEDVLYSSLNFPQKNVQLEDLKKEEQTLDDRKSGEEQSVYSDVKHFGWEEHM